MAVEGGRMKASSRDAGLFVRFIRFSVWAFSVLAIIGCPIAKKPETGDAGDDESGFFPEIEVRQGDGAVANNGIAGFGSVCINTANEVTFTIVNCGTADLNLTGVPEKVTKSGSDESLFEVTSQPFSPISPNGSTLFRVRFSAAAAGEKTATLAIGNDDPDRNPFTLILTATGILVAAAIPTSGLTASQASGDDGDLQVGATWPIPRFTDNGDGTVSDNLTGLMWEKAPNGTTRTWANAIGYSNALTLGTYSDWRLPNINELESLLNAGESSSAVWLNTQGFSGVKGDYYWSSTTFASDADYAWMADMGYGSVGTGCVSDGRKEGEPDISGLKLYCTWAVRNGQLGVVSLPKTGQTASHAAGDDGDLQKGLSWPTPRFADNGNGTITDLLTGLMWQKTPPTYIRTWADALANANNLTLAGYSDWRMPNRKELRSLIGYSQPNSASWLINEGFTAASYYYWSATPYPVGAQHAWIVFMSQGQVFLEYKVPSPAYWKLVWAVRGG
jgi:hypothetical protein